MTKPPWTVLGGGVGDGATPCWRRVVQSAAPFQRCRDDGVVQDLIKVWGRRGRLLLHERSLSLPDSQHVGTHVRRIRNEGDVIEKRLLDPTKSIADDLVATTDDHAHRGLEYAVGGQIAYHVKI